MVVEVRLPSHAKLTGHQTAAECVIGFDILHRIDNPIHHNEAWPQFAKSAGQRHFLARACYTAKQEERFTGTLSIEFGHIPRLS
jgi:hypothetical protein